VDAWDIRHAMGHTKESKLTPPLPLFQGEKKRWRAGFGGNWVGVMFLSFHTIVYESH